MNRADDLDGSVAQALRTLGHELVAVGCTPDEYVLFGSTVMYLHGLRDTCGDVDAFVTRRVWGALLARDGWYVETPAAGDPPILTYDAALPLHLFFDWKDADLWIDVPRCLEQGESVQMWRCIPLTEVRRHKLVAEAGWERRNVDDYRRQKHIDDVAVLNAALGEVAA